MMHRATLLYGTLLLGCVQSPITGDPSEGGASSSDTPGGETSSVPTTGGPATSSTDAVSSTRSTTESSSAGASTSGGPSPDTCGFICDDPTDATSTQCDMFLQDCPEGEKCAAYAEGGNGWNALKCVPVGDAQPGEPCTVVESAASGLDNCAKGAMCWNIDERLQGRCVALCSGSESMPVCAKGFACNASEVLSLCLPSCDPILQDCPDEELCIPSGGKFTCGPDASGDDGQVFDECEFINVCDKGLCCLGPQHASECAENTDGCCLPFCDLSVMDLPCPGTGQVCTPWFDGGAAPPEYEHVGVCILPE